MIEAPVQNQTTSVVANVSSNGTSVTANVSTSAIVVECPVYNGRKGDAGEQGARGEAGEQGPQGLPGADGHSPVLALVGDQISIDGVVSGPHLTGPKGDTGEKGDQRVFVQDAQPNFNGLTGIWLQTGMANNGFTIWFEDGE